jgi:hypothetical protein
LQEIQCVNYKEKWYFNPKFELSQIFKIKTRLRDIIDVRQENDGLYFG